MLLGPPAVPFKALFVGEGSPTKIDKTEKSWYPDSSLSTGGPRLAIVETGIWVRRDGTPEV